MKQTTTSGTEQILLEYWKRKLKDCTPMLNFPYDSQQKIISQSNYSSECFALDQHLTSQLKKICEAEGTSLSAILLTSLVVLVHKYSGDNDIIVPIHGEDPFILRLQIEEDITFKKLLHNSNNEIIEAVAHSGIPLIKLLKIIHPDSSTDNELVSEVAFTLNDNKEGSSLKRSKEQPSNVSFDLNDDGQVINGRIKYRSNLLNQATISRIRENYVTLLHRIVSNPEVHISSVSILSENEIKLLDQLNNTRSPLPYKLAHEFFENQVKLTPLRKALKCKNNILSYNELNESANQLAHHLISMGLTSGSVVGICLERSPEIIISILAVLKAGGCYLPLDPALPDDRFNFLFEDSDAKILITHSSLRKKFQKELKNQVVLIDNDQIRIKEQKTQNPGPDITSQSPAYMIYTSGSTGKPKGVKVHHESVVNLVNSISKRPGVTPDDRLLAVTTHSFDISVLEVFLPLSYGAELIMAESDDISDGQKLLVLLEENDVTLLQTTPATWNILLYCGWKGKANLKAFCGGEAILPGLVKEMLPRVESFWNLYGPTETCVYSTCFKITDPDAPIMVGTPIDNTKIFILDKYDNRVPAGAIGEVCIGGLGVAKGYFGKPELTGRKFIQYNKEEFIYKTGDLGRILPDGNIELLGRNDHQIKIRGYRIEPGEIENVLSLIPGVKEAVVKVQKFGEYDDRLVAFLNTDSSFSLNREQVTHSLGNYLPQYMIPAFIQILNEFPRMPNRKINRNALVINPDEIGNLMNNELESFTPTQKQLLHIWQNILRIREVRLTDDFFDMGGNSLLAISFLNKMEESLHRRIPYKEFRSNPTILSLSDYLHKNTETVDLSPVITHSENNYDLPLSKNQSRIWLTTKLNPSRVNYNLSFTYHLTGPLDSELFQKSIKLLFNRHHILFSSITDRDGVPYVSINATDACITFIDHSDLSKGTREEEIYKFISADSRIVIDFQKDPLYRLFLFKCSAEEYYFYFTVHHIVFDGWSWKVFINDLYQIYNDLQLNNELSIKNPEYQQYDFALSEKKNENETDFEKSSAFWKDLLKDCSTVLNFPFDYPRLKALTGYGDREFIRFSPEISAALRSLSKNEGISLFSTMLTTFGILMHKYSGDNDLNIGTPLANRSLSSMEPVIGMFVNTVVIRLKFDEQISFRDLLKTTNEIILDAIAHQDFSFEKIVAIVNPERIPDINPLFQAAFAWDDNLDIPLKLNGIRSEKVFMHGGTSTFDITCSLLDNGETIQGDIEYNTDILKQETIIRLRDHYIGLVSRLISEQNSPVSSVSLLTPEENKRLIQFSGLKTPYPAGTISQLFEKQVNTYPQNKAVVYRDEWITYDDLNRKSNQLARTLQENGISKNMIVGILADKSIDLIIGLLAILKSGGAYLPLDTDYPDERLNFMIHDSNCRLLLTQNKYQDLKINNIDRITIDSPSSYHNDDANLLNEVTSDDLAYVMYTSGTTGQPKGSLICQKSVARLVLKTNYIEIKPEDRFLLTGAIVFDATTFEIWGPLLNGGSLYIVDKEEILDPGILGKTLLKNQITILWLTSALFTQIAENRTDIFGGLKFLLVGGDIISPPHINKVRKNNPDLAVINGYGPTENTTFTTCYRIEKDFDFNIPIGKPISNTTVYILDKGLNLQPVGIIGELYAGGDGLSKGYLNRDDLNKSKFVDHPYVRGERLYRTGDYGKWLPDGNIEFHGRMDNQVKIRGFRVELAELESVLSEIEGVIDTVVKAFRLSDSDTRLVAFLNVTDSYKMTSGEIQEILKSRVPSFMVPSVIRIMHGFKLTVNGKIDRDALKYEPEKISENGSGQKMSLSDTERKVHKIWCEILKLDEISPEDNFFDIGGNSLLSISVLSKIQKEFKLESGLRVFFDHPRIREFSAFIDNSAKEMAESTFSKEKDKTRIIQGEI